LIGRVTEKVREKIAYWPTKVNPPYTHQYAHFPHDSDGDIEQSLLTFAGLEVRRSLPAEALPTSRMKDERVSIGNCGGFSHVCPFSVREKRLSSSSGRAASLWVVDGETEEEKAIGQQHRR
jgi:hypothetical protein